MKPRTLPLVAFVLLAASAVNAQTPPAPSAPEAPAAPAHVVAPAAPPAPASDVLAAIADAPEAPEAPPAPVAVLAGDLPEPPDAPLPPQEPAAPAPPAVATTLFVSGNFLGVRTEEVTRENMQRYGLSGEPRGVGVREVVKGSPAEKAGLRANDVIVRFDGEPVTSVRKLSRLVEESAPDHVARITVARGGSEQELSATLTRREPFVSAGGEGFYNLSPDVLGNAMRLGDEEARNTEQWRRAQEQAQQKWEELARKHPGLFAGSTRRIGVTTNALGKQLADYFGVAHGVLVSSVEEGSPAEKAGIKAGDIVTEADGQQVEDSDDLTRALSSKEEGEVTLTVVRERKSRTVRVTPERRTAPQGLFAPGAFRLLEMPVAAFTLPGTGIQMHPDVLSLPRTVVTPRLLTAPRVRATPRARVFGLGDHVL
ncbi:MAG: PDZ domain-containing protein [Acidobacteria bacterium]|nr:PDZ domain-containing protein [Acidobacteriota bacterium]